MIPLYEVTILLNSTLIAMTVTVFVFAVSLLGRAIEIATEQNEKARQEQREKIKKEIGEIQKELEKVRQTGELEETKRPELRLYFRDKGPPFHLEKDSTVEIKFVVSLTQGDVARDVEVWFLAPEGFNFPDIFTWKQTKSFKDFPGYLTGRVAWDKSLKRGISYRESLSLKTPSEAGEFTLAYRLLCEGFEGEYKKFEVIVE